MKFFSGLLLAAAVADAYYTFPRLVVNGKPEDKDWSVTRSTKNPRSKQGIENENPTSNDIRCYSSRTAANIATVLAGSTIHYVSTQQINHPGLTHYYLAKVPARSSVTKWDGSGAAWLKIATTMPTIDKNKQLTWPGQNAYTAVNATIPTGTPSGEYLLRVEHVPLHMAMQANKAQFCLSCSQISITSGGNSTPGPLVSQPGLYKRSDPSIQVNLGAIKPEAYRPPGSLLELSRSKHVSLFEGYFSAVAPLVGGKWRRRADRKLPSCISKPMTR
ncbi:glycosyl hydrolase family 61-domain-containing protein [Lasiosphaeria ovina]|uniref:lytic cellulose monooxygenase (C4-dehydrogenating) n=1 Tax=Lasiosphaeria ovina TaxID=92902 RepID=A0AAE0K468_9PEZI|nr:glycosyl hydrolase family 61-domain-containing protein [Lasiosphaeria ovina]